jgi:hypothetical protein
MVRLKRKKARPEHVAVPPPPPLPPPPPHIEEAQEFQRAKPRSQSAKREHLRSSLFPDDTASTWDRRKNQGFTTVPRLLGLVMVLIKDKSEKRGDASRVYLDLWLRAYDEGIVLVVHDDDFAYSSGYKGTRALRTWRERMFALQELGFIKIQPRGNTEIGFVLILNPLLVCARLKKEKKVDVEWWNAFVTRAAEVGAVIPSL